MENRLQRGRMPAIRIFMMLTAVLTLSSTGCLGFEKQTAIVVLKPERDEARVLIVYEAFFVLGRNKSALQRAEKELTRLFQERQQFYLGNPLLAVDLTSQKGTKLSEESNKDMDFLRRHISILRASMFLNGKGELCGYQTIRVRSLKKFLAGLNERISKTFAKAAAERLADEKKRGPIWDRESLLMVQDAAAKRYPWLRIDDGRISFSLPGSQAFFRNLKQHFLNELLKPLHDIAAPGKLKDSRLPATKSPAIDPEVLHVPVAEIDYFAKLFSDNAWSLEQHPGRMTFFIGLGKDEPIRVRVDSGPHEQRLFDNQLRDYAQGLSPHLEKGLEAEQIMAKFIQKNLRNKSKRP